MRVRSENVCACESESEREELRMCVYPCVSESDRERMRVTVENVYVRVRMCM